MSTRNAQLTVRDGHTKEVTHHPVTIEGQLTHAAAMRVVTNHNGYELDAGEFADAEQEGNTVYFDPFTIVVSSDTYAHIEDQSGTAYTIIVI